jgi:hypothetical protein
MTVVLGVLIAVDVLFEVVDRRLGWWCRERRTPAHRRDTAAFEPQDMAGIPAWNFGFHQPAEFVVPAVTTIALPAVVCDPGQAV